MKQHPFPTVLFAIVLALFATVAFAQTTATQGTAAQTGALKVDSNVANSEVYLDGGYVGTTPCAIEALAPGLHVLDVRKRGYEGISCVIRIIAGDEISYKAQLRPIRGKLAVTNIPKGVAFEIVIGDTSYTSLPIELPEGDYAVTIREFGYADKKRNVSVVRHQTVEIDGTLEKAPFAASDFRSVKKAFNPMNPARLGNAEFLFLVTAPGTGTLTVRLGDAIIRTIAVGPFTRWKQSVIWDGKDDGGTVAPDGEYGITLEATGDGSAERAALSSTIGVDSSIEYPFTDCVAGIGSVGPVVSAALIPKNGVSFDFGLKYRDGFFGPAMSVHGSPLNRLEAGFIAEVNTTGDSASDFLAAGGLKYGASLGRAKAALALTYRARPNAEGAIDPLDRAGVSLSPAIEYSFARAAIGLAPTLSWGNEKGFAPNAEWNASIGTEARYVDSGYSAGFWASSATRGLGSGLPSFGGWSSGIVARVMIPDTNLSLDAQAGWERRADGGGSLIARGGLGVVF
jgi:hypothetical protein